MSERPLNPKALATLQRQEIRRLLHLAVDSAYHARRNAASKRLTEARQAIENHVEEQVVIPATKRYKVLQKKKAFFYTNSRTANIDITFNIKIPKRLMSAFVAADDAFAKNERTVGPSELQIELAVHELAGLNSTDMATAIKATVEKLFQLSA